jgi:hypothetical protein
MAWIKKHWILLSVATGGLFLLWYLYTNGVFSGGSSSSAPTCVPGDPTCDPAAAALAQLQAAQSAQVAGGGTNTGTQLANVLSPATQATSASTASTPALAPNATPATPSGAVVQPGTSASGVPSSSNQTQQFSTNTPPPSVSPVTPASVAGAITPTSQLGGADTGAAAAYNAAFATQDPQTAAALQAAGLDPYLLYQAQQQNPDVTGPTIGASNSEIAGLVTGAGVTTQAVLLPSEESASSGSGTTGSASGMSATTAVPATSGRPPLTSLPQPVRVTSPGQITATRQPTYVSSGQTGGSILPSNPPATQIPAPSSSSSNPIAKLPIVKPLSKS